MTIKKAMSVERVMLIMHGVGNAWPELHGRRMTQFEQADCPLNGRGNTSLSLVAILDDGNAVNILVDFGAGCVESIMRANLPWPDVIVLTHGFHLDHANPRELDTLGAALHGRTIPLVTCQESWDLLPHYQRSKFVHIPISAGETSIVNAGTSGLPIKIEAIDASTHCKGALAYILTIGDLRFGALFDLRSWEGVPKALCEGLDWAVLDSNSIFPLSDQTTHTSVAENLVFLRSLSRPIRLALLTHFGSDDKIVPSDGSLISMLAGLAPDLPVRLAYRWMTISSDTLPPRNPVAVLDPDTNLVVGVREKRDVHRHGLLHASTLLLVSNASGNLVVCERGSDQDFAGTLDIFGGHVMPSEANDIRRAALREAREEIVLLTADGFVAELRDEWLIPLSEPFALECTNPTNRERSTLFGVRVPDGLTIRAYDENHEGNTVERNTRHTKLGELMTILREKPDSLADGLRRVLQCIDEDVELRTTVQQFME